MTFHPDAENSEDILMWRMTKAMQIDVASAVRTRDLPVTTLSRMMQNCHKCVDPKMCKVFLERREDEFREPPGFCPNKARLSSLRSDFGPPDA